MKKLHILAATATFALSLWGCASTSNARADADEPPLDEATDYGTQARKDRAGAPTVYDGEPSGDSGVHSKVTTPDGQTWDVQEEPGGDEPRTPGTQDDESTGTGGAGQAQEPSDKASEATDDDATEGSGPVRENVDIIDEGPTDEAPRK